MSLPTSHILAQQDGGEPMRKAALGDHMRKHPSQGKWQPMDNNKRYKNTPALWLLCFECQLTHQISSRAKTELRPFPHIPSDHHASGERNQIKRRRRKLSSTSTNPQMATVTRQTPHAYQTEAEKAVTITLPCWISCVLLNGFLTSMEFNLEQRARHGVPSIHFADWLVTKEVAFLTPLMLTRAQAGNCCCSAVD